MSVILLTLIPSRPSFIEPSVATKSIPSMHAAVSLDYVETRLHPVTHLIHTEVCEGYLRYPAID